jgi:hypothetical protein
VNQVNRNLQEWGTQGAQPVRVASAFAELIIPLSNCPGLPESYQLDFIERIDTPDLSLSDSQVVKKDPFILLRNLDTCSDVAKGGQCRAIQIKNRAVMLQFDGDADAVLTWLPWKELQMG